MFWVEQKCCFLHILFPSRVCNFSRFKLITGSFGNSLCRKTFSFFEILTLRVWNLLFAVSIPDTVFCPKKAYSQNVKPPGFTCCVSNWNLFIKNNFFATKYNYNLYFLKRVLSRTTAQSGDRSITTLQQIKSLFNTANT